MFTFPLSYFYGSHSVEVSYFQSFCLPSKQKPPGGICYKNPGPKLALGHLGVGVSEVYWVGKEGKLVMALKSYGAPPIHLRWLCPVNP